MPIEVQLRTRRQQEWAGAIEQIEARTGELLKDGHGDADTIEMFALLADAYAYLDRGEPIPQEILDELTRWLQQQASNDRGVK